MSQQLPNRIETQVSVETRVKPIGISLILRVTGSAPVGSVAALRKSKELLAIRELMGRLDVAENKIQIDSVAFETGERWLSGSSVEIDLELTEIPLSAVPEALAGLSAMKGVSLTQVRREYGDLTAERDELLSTAVIQSMRQARLIASAAGLPLRSIHSLSQNWSGPEPEESPHHYPLALGAASAGSLADQARGYQLIEQKQGRLALHLRAEICVGEFDEAR